MVYPPKIREGRQKWTVVLVKGIMISEIQETDDGNETYQPEPGPKSEQGQDRGEHFGSNESAANATNEPQRLVNSFGFVGVTREGRK